jgi:CheY-like chemotaxis protein
MTMPNARQDRPRILCVDDEPRVLAAIERALRSSFDVVAVDGPARALELLGRGERFAVLVSDLQMPGMDGIELLAAARTREPDAVRVLLTGHADLDAAIDAVNDGNVFQFLRKPCPPRMLLRTLRAAVEQYRLVTAERELLEQTLRGSVRMLADVLALASPTVFGRAERVQRLAAELAARLGVPDRWSVEIAATVWHLGCVTLPPAVADKVSHGVALQPDEARLVGDVPVTAVRLIGHIPRLERVRELLQAASQPTNGDRVGLGAQVLRAALELDTLEARGLDAGATFDALDVLLAGYDPRVLAELRELRGYEGASSHVREMRLLDIALGMVFAEDVVNGAGLLLIARGQEVTMPLVERVRTYWSDDAARETVRMIVRTTPPSPVRADVVEHASGRG